MSEQLQKGEEKKQDFLMEIAISHLLLRKAVGVLGFLMPIILVLVSYLIGEQPIRSSISCYYHSGARDFFEGILWTFAVFLLFYRYEKKDNIAAILAGFFALVSAICPVDEAVCVCSNISSHDASSISGRMHNLFSSFFFIVLSYMSIWLFTLTNIDKAPSKQKLKRNRIYRTCGITMLVCIILIGIYMFWGENKVEIIDKMNPIFCLETIAMFSFGISWAVKGELIIKDRNSRMKA